ncbi:MAG TPA: hypothetical protein VF826_09910 [Chloroflexia bacterium]|jgi:hypothetical protein
MSDTVLAAVLGGGFALATLFMTLYFQHKQQDAIARQKYAEIFLLEQIKRLNEFSTSLSLWFTEIMECDRILPPDANILRNRLSPRMHEAFGAYARTRIFLPTNVDTSIQVLLDSILKLVKEIDNRIALVTGQAKPHDDLDTVTIEDVTEQYLDTMSQLHSLLNPPVLDRLRAKTLN